MVWVGVGVFRAWLLLEVAFFFALAGVVLGCGGDEPPPSASSGPPPVAIVCAPEEQTLEDGRCQPPGLPIDRPCGPGETPRLDGGCEPAGVPPDKCWPGFEPDGEQGCKAILPDAPCSVGKMAQLGETQCREVAPCGAGDYGDIPVEANTEFVNAAYAGFDSNGTKAKPWKTIQQAINAAESGAIVAVAKGTYIGDIAITGPKVVHLWGRCPSMVTVNGSGAGSYAISVSGLTSSQKQIVLRGFAVTGPKRGIYVTGAPDVVIENVWIHDLPEHAVVVTSESGAAGVTVRSSLIERMGAFGISNQSAALTVDGTTVRDVLIADTSKEGDGVPDGRGIAATLLENSQTRPSLTIRSSIVERATAQSVAVEDADAVIEGLLVRDAKPIDSKNVVGRGVHAVRSNVALRGSVIERAHNVGVMLGCSTGTVEQVTVRDTKALPSTDGYGAAGLGIGALDLCKSCPDGTCVTIRETLVHGSGFAGIGVSDMAAVIESTAVRGTQRNSLVPGSYGALVILASAEIRRSSFEHNNHLGVAATTAALVVEDSLVRDVQGDPSIKGPSACVYIDAGPDDLVPLSDLTVRGSLLEACAGGGVHAVSAATTIDATHIRDVTPNANGDAGDGVLLYSHYTSLRATGTVTGTRIESVARAGISSFGSAIDLGRTAVSCAVFDLLGEKTYGRAFTYNKLGENVCGCASEPGPCQVLSPGFAPPNLGSISPP